MATLLHSIKSIRLYSREFHPTTLNIYDEYMVYIKRGLIRRNEATISYNHVSQVYLRKGFLTASIEIINTGGVENILISYLDKSQARKAKQIIDQKIYHSHAKVSNMPQTGHHQTPDFEKKLARLKELKLRGAISEREFEQKRKEMLKSL